MESCIYEGLVRHRRFVPVENSFTYSLFMTYLDLAELPTIFKGRWLWSADPAYGRGTGWRRRPALARFRREDHLGDPTVSLDASVRDLVLEKTGRRPAGPIRLLTHLRYFGYGFNPVSFYYCFDALGSRLETVVAEVSNTPWNEMHPYVLDETMNEGDAARKRYRFHKEFHVSPFMDMDFDYDWRFTTPGRALTVHMDNLKAGSKLFDATMTLERREITGPGLARALAWHPFMTGKVIAAIYGQALRLWLKRCPFYPHPKHAGARA